MVATKTRKIKHECDECIKKTNCNMVYVYTGVQTKCTCKEVK